MAKIAVSRDAGRDWRSRKIYKITFGRKNGRSIREN